MTNFVCGRCTHDSSQVCINWDGKGDPYPKCPEKSSRPKTCGFSRPLFPSELLEVKKEEGKEK